MGSVSSILRFIRNVPVGEPPAERNVEAQAMEADVPVAVVVVYAAAEGDVDAEGNAAADGNADAEGNADVDSNADSNADAQGDAHGDAEGDGDAHGDAEGNADAHGDAEGHGDAHGDAEGDGDAHGDAEGDGNAQVVQEEHDSEVAGPAAGQVGHKRKGSPTGPRAKVPCRKSSCDRPRSPYESHYLGGEGRDVKIRAFGEEWYVHKAYLCQSGYFSSMFSGIWQEASQDIIEMQMPDSNISRDSFHEALCYLYSNTISISYHQVVSISATASMLQLDELLEHCGRMMIASVTIDTVCSYYYAGENYGLQHVRYVCLQWLLDNLIIKQNDQLLLDINQDVMKELIVSSDLLVIEAEMDVYTTLKKWMFLQLEPTWSGSQSALLAAANSFFARHKSNSSVAPFLETDQGRAFASVFQQLRLPYIISDLPSARIINQDALIPAAWLTPIYKEQYLALIQAEQSRALGPVGVCVSDEDGHSMRCGGQIHRDEECSWTWSGFSFGWDLVVCYTNKRIVFRRSALNKSCGLGVSLLWQRKVAFRLRVISLDETGKSVFRSDTEYHVLALGKDQELEVVNLEGQDITFPLYVACNFLYLPGQSCSNQRGYSGKRP